MISASEDYLKSELKVATTAVIHLVSTSRNELGLCGTFRGFVSPFPLAEKEVLVHGGALSSDDLARSPELKGGGGRGRRDRLHQLLLARSVSVLVRAEDAEHGVQRWMAFRAGARLVNSSRGSHQKTTGSRTR